MHRRFSIPAANGRNQSWRLERRNGANDSKLIRGYGAVFYNSADPNTEYWLWDDIVERLMPGCFDKVIKDNQDVRCLFNHDMNWVLGRTASGTCRIGTDATGLWYECDESAADPQWISVAQKLNRGDVTGSSFSFYPSSTIWETVKADGKTYDVRWIKEVSVCYDVGPVTFPAYAAATSGRSIANEERQLLLAERNLRRDDSEELAMRLKELQLWE